MKIKNSALFLAVVLALAVSCSKDDRNAPRTDGFELHALADCSDEPLKEYCVDILEGTSELYLKTDLLDFDVFWQDAAPSPWLEVVSYLLVIIMCLRTHLYCSVDTLSMPVGVLQALLVTVCFCLFTLSSGKVTPRLPPALPK